MGRRPVPKPNMLFTTIRYWSSENLRDPVAENRNVLVYLQNFHPLIMFGNNGHEGWARSGYTTYGPHLWGSYNDALKDTHLTLEQALDIFKDSRHTIPPDVDKFMQLEAVMGLLGCTPID